MGTPGGIAKTSGLDDGALPIGYDRVARVVYVG
jgi:hypothetical protein